MGPLEFFRGQRSRAFPLPSSGRPISHRERGGGLSILPTNPNTRVKYGKSDGKIYSMTFFIHDRPIEKA